jgi:hypothetical protein
MSATTPTLTPGPGIYAQVRTRAPSRAGEVDRPWIRLCTFAALAGYATVRWATLLRPAPGLRLLGELGLAVALAGAVPFLMRRSRLAAAAGGVVVALLAFPVAGLRWHWLVHMSIARTSIRIGNGLSALPNALIPYLGHDRDVRLVIVLGAAVLLFDAAAVLAYAPKGLGEGRRAAAALPLIALAVVPSTLIRPRAPYLQGLLLFILIAAFMWGERVRPGASSSAVLLVLAAGIGAAIVAPRIDQGSPWVNYRAWTGSTVPVKVDAFNWNQTYGPLRWPHAGHEVLSVQAKRPDYWKAENLDAFNGFGWVAAPVASQPGLPAPDRQDAARWTQTIRVSIVGMRTTDVVAAGDAAHPSQIAGGSSPGSDPGTWVAGQAIGPGTNYDVATYSPHPTAAQLTHAAPIYPVPLLAGDLTLGVPVTHAGLTSLTQVTFPLFHSADRRSATIGPIAPPNPSLVGRALSRSPYAGAYALAGRLAAQARTPAAFVQSVLGYLSTQNGFTYNQTPPPSRYPLISFLFSAKQGYCQQFSGAMAMLLRMGGVPARVAAGFTPGAYDSLTHRYVVTDVDAHAWVEVWFPRYGWVRFDPTPGSAPARAGTNLPPILKSTGAVGKQSALTARRDPVTGSAGAGGSIHHRTGGGTSVWLIVPALALASLLAGILWRLTRRGGRRLQDDERLAELERALARTRRPLPDGVTLASLEHRLRSSPDAAGYVRALRVSRYGGDPAAPSAAQRRALRQELARGLGFIGRLRALWALPPRF